MKKNVNIDTDFTKAFEGVQMLNTTPAETEVTAEAVEDTALELVNYETLSKEELINLHKTKDSSINNYQMTLENKEEEHRKEIEGLNKYYGDRIKELNSLVKYYERKLKLINDFINIETGGVK
jgi:hypothetical protein